MPSLRSRACSAPRSPLATAASAAFSRRSFSEAAYRRRFLRGTLSSDAPFSPAFRCACSSTSERPELRDGLGTFGVPFSAQQYRDIQSKLSHATLAQRRSEE